MPNQKVVQYRRANQLAKSLELPRQWNYATSTARSLAQHVQRLEAIQAERTRLAEREAKIAKLEEAKIAIGPPNFIMKVVGGSFRKLAARRVRVGAVDTPNMVVRNLDGRRVGISPIGPSVAPVLRVRLDDEKDNEERLAVLVQWFRTQNMLEENGYDGADLWYWFPDGTSLADIGGAIPLGEQYPLSIQTEVVPIEQADSSDIIKALVERPMYEGGECAITGPLVWLGGRRRFKNLSREKLKADFLRVAPDCFVNGAWRITTKHVMLLMADYKVSCYAADYDGSLVLSQKRDRSVKGTPAMCYTINLEHMTILDGMQRKALMGEGRLPAMSKIDPAIINVVEAPCVGAEFDKLMMRDPSVGTLSHIVVGNHYSIRSFYDPVARMYTQARPTLTLDNECHAAITKMGHTVEPGTIAKMSRDFLGCYVNLPRSCLSPTMLKSVLGGPGPHKFIGVAAAAEPETSWDISKCYSAAVYYRRHDWGYFGITSQWHEIDQKSDGDEEEEKPIPVEAADDEAYEMGYTVRRNEAELEQFYEMDEKAQRKDTRVRLVARWKATKKQLEPLISTWDQLTEDEQRRGTTLNELIKTIVGQIKMLKKPGVRAVRPVRPAAHEQHLVPGARYIIGSAFSIPGRDFLAGHNFDSQFVSDAISMGAIKLSDLTHILTPETTVPAKTMKAWVEAAYATGHGKSLVNYAVGGWGTHTHTKTAGYITDHWRGGMAQKEGAVYNDLGHDRGLVYKTNSRRVLDNNVPMHRAVVEAGIIDLARLTKMAGGKVHSWITDCVVGVGLNDLTGQWLYPKNRWGLGKIRSEELKPRMPTECWPEHRFGWRLKEPAPFKAEWQSGSVSDLIEGGGMLIGAPGTGKTHCLINEIVPELKKRGLRYMTLAPTHSVKDLHNSSGLDSRTAASVLTAKEGSQRTPIRDLAESCDVVIVDEMTMLGAKTLEALARAHAAGVKVILIGDPNQLPAVNIIDGEYVNIHITDLDVVRGMCPVIHVLTKLHRYDMELAAELQGVLDGKAMPGRKMKGDILDATHIAYTNKTVKAVNKSCLASFNLNAKHKSRWPVGAPVVCHSNDLYGVWNGWRGLVKNDDREGKKSTINGKVFSYEEMDKYFSLGWCTTVHKAQGRTVNGQLWIHEAGKMDKNMLYTAMSRATSLDNIGMTKCTPESTKWSPLVMPRVWENKIQETAPTKYIDPRPELRVARKLVGSISVGKKHVVYKWLVAGKQKRKKWAVGRRSQDKCVALAKDFQLLTSK